ncbi:hypothetical protein [Hymenobacter sp. UYCo722]|uniref:hypothetical protein n=1 Tax=Hymenobacter sp. UYCo722 TaxID=3156335 RepID=UPI0033924919
MRKLGNVVQPLASLVRHDGAVVKPFEQGQIRFTHAPGPVQGVGEQLLLDWPDGPGEHLPGTGLTFMQDHLCLAAPYQEQQAERKVER